MNGKFLKNGLTKAWELTDSLLSRGLTGCKIPEEIRDIREISCHGSEELNLSPCIDRNKSKKYQESFFCGACNCGDFLHTQLTNLNKTHYSKLDYPRVRCPRKMPGFSNYVPLTISENDMRKGLIEQTFGVDYLKSLNEEENK